MRKTRQEAEQEITVGKKYKHYKGHMYRILAIARHSETDEGMVVYQEIGKNNIWTRPKSMWNEVVDLGDRKVLRFTLVEEF